MRTNIRSKHMPIVLNGRNNLRIVYVFPMSAISIVRLEDKAWTVSDLCYKHNWPVEAYVKLVGRIEMMDIKNYRNDYRHYKGLIETLTNIRRYPHGPKVSSNFVKKSHQRWSNLTAADFWDGDNSHCE